MAALTKSEYDYSFYKFKQYSSSGSFNFGDYDNIDLDCTSTSVVSFEDNFKEHNDIHQSIGDEFDQVLRCVPKNELDTLPSDAASEVDHYIYGTPKRKQ